ncbi:MAG TPA: GGDEF domain-containing protein [Solirubrobacteraceae bacterium]|jgi:diguanylate cyclase (GGDEF)-like protein
MARVGTDTYEPAPGIGSEMDSLLASVRRLSHVADSAGEPREIFRALAGELFAECGVEEVQLHHLAEREDTVVVYMFGGEGRLSYLAPPGERSHGVAWVAESRMHVTACGARELAAAVPRLAATGTVGAALLLPLSVRGEVEAVVILARRQVDGEPIGADGVPFDERAVQCAATLIDQAATALALLRARAEAGTDPVTGCMNHRAMRRRLNEEIGRATRTDGRLACLLIDLDNFKLVNDRHGHSAGDALLREVAQALMGEFRAFDRVARYGGDEFVVILAGADLESAAVAAERARERMLEVPSFDIVPGVSASIGVAQWRAPMSTDMLLDACDAALLEGKRSGKGRVTRAA